MEIFTKNLDKRIDLAWDFVMNTLYNPKTKMIYDLLSGKEGAWGFEHLPTLEEIEANVPNPCGWGTGMEDCNLSGWSMIEAICARYAATGDESLRALSDDLFDGLYLCATVSKKKGFLARGVSPIDGKSHYINSSRDQYTHWAYMGVGFYNSPLCSKAQKRKIEKVLVSFAEAAEREVTEENEYSLLREDNKPSWICEMYGDETVMHPHEYFRLPMIYIGAYAVTKDEHWWDKYAEYREWGLSGSEKITKKEILDVPYCYALLQMQYSLRLAYDYEKDERYKTRLYNLMRKIAENTPRHTVDAMEKLPSLVYKTDLRGWREIPASCIKVHHGRGWYMQTPDANDLTFRILRNGAEGLLISTLCPKYAPPQEQIAAFEKIVNTVDFAKASIYWPLLYCDAYWLTRAEMK